jgi:hypothetical protein
MQTPISNVITKMTGVAQTLTTFQSLLRSPGTVRFLESTHSGRSRN